MSALGAVMVVITPMALSVPQTASEGEESLGEIELRETAAETLPLDAWAMMPAITQASVSPDGQHLAIVRAQNINGNYLIEIHEVDNLLAEPVRLGAERMEVEDFVWLNNEKIFVAFRQNIQDGNRNYWAGNSAIVNADGSGRFEMIRTRSSGSGRIEARTSQTSNADLLDMLVSRPDEILVLYRANRNDRYPDVGLYNLNTKRLTTIYRGNSQIDQGLGIDKDGDVRVGYGFNPTRGEIEVYARLKDSEEWDLAHVISPHEREEFDILDFSTSEDDPNEVYVKANNGNNYAGIYLFNLATKKLSECLFCPQGVDAGGVILSNKPDSLGELLGFDYATKHPERYFIDAEEQALYDSVQELFPDKFVELDRSDDDNTIVVWVRGDDDPGSYYLLRNKQDLQYIASASTIEPEHLSPVKYVKFTARDGMEIPAYVTIPRGQPPFPAVVLPHGGPWIRETVIYDEWSQLLAHHGYIVIQPQYRGSTGFGLEHWIAGDKKWGLEMQDDVDDAALYLVEEGLADRDRLAIFGWSYGGYSAFVGSMREDNIYQCAISGAGVSDINLMNAGIGGNPYLRRFQKPTRQGVSPIEHVEDVNVPILVIHGDIDGRVSIEHSRRFVTQLERYNKDYKYIELEGADHFTNTLYYDHKTEFYGALLDWLETKCQ
ncbi:MAG: alpha/beta hydrolase family protein [Pseudohongiellaceae bacterium]